MGVDNSTISRHTPSSGWSKSLLESLDTIWVPCPLGSINQLCHFVFHPRPTGVFWCGCHVRLHKEVQGGHWIIRTSLFSKVTSLDERACSESLELTGFTIACVNTTPIPISGSLGIRMEVTSWEADRFGHGADPSYQCLCSM